MYWIEETKDDKIKDKIMAIWETITSLVKDLFKPAVDLVDELHTSGEEKMVHKENMLKLKIELENIQTAITTKLIEYHTAVMEAQQEIVVAEAKGDGWLQKSWRPIAMLVFMAMIVITWLGFSSSTVSEEMHIRILDIVQGGLWGYIGARSVEKVGTFFKRKKLPTLGELGIEPLKAKRK